MIEATTLEQELQQFTGTEQYYFNSMYKWMNYTDGVKFLAERAGAYWLLDIIGTELKQFNDDFQIIELEVANNKAVITSKRDTNEPNLWDRNIEFTDFPEGTWKFYLIDGVLLLPSEY